jgi:hypothetical protein
LRNQAGRILLWRSAIHAAKHAPARLPTGTLALRIKRPKPSNTL